MKNVMMKKEKVLILICFGVIFFSCGIPVTSYGEENEDKNKEISSTTIEENSELFEKKILVMKSFLKQMKQTL